ncbi:MAG: helix-turn-helix transcriptional regulator [Oscillospiraceae bacterium]|nr:helix-turn-helix transcriptional regulator [Oscillospiraceae bacterium]
MNNLKLKILRIKAGLNQAELAGRLNVTQAAISSWERGLTMPGTKIIPKLAKTLNCTIDELYGEG